jgi:hypothetical protein
MKNILIFSITFLIAFSNAKPPVVIKPLNPNDPQQLPSSVTKNVLIVGGGLAGILLFYYFNYLI